MTNKNIYIESDRWLTVLNFAAGTDADRITHWSDERHYKCHWGNTGEYSITHSLFPPFAAYRGLWQVPLGKLALNPG